MGKSDATREERFLKGLDMNNRTNKMHTLVFHIGTPKTGTTSIQTFLYNNSEELKRYGWCYPPFNHIWYRMERGWGYPNLKRNGIVFRRSFMEDWDRRKKMKLWGFVRSYLRRYNVIISEEWMWGSLGIDLIKSLGVIKEICPNIKIIVYLRRQDLFVDAWWNQKVKSGDLQVENIGIFKNEKYVVESLDYYSIIHQIEGLIGKENLIVRVFEKESFIQGDLIKDFLASLEIPVDWNRVKDNEKRENERLDEDLLAVKLEFNKTYAKYISEISRRSVTVQNNIVGAKIPDRKRFGYLSPEEREEIIKKYEEGNRIIAKDYLGREDGVLFRDRNVQIPVYNANLSEREKRIIHLFAKIAAEQDNKLEKLRQQKPWDYFKKALRGIAGPIARHILIMIRKICYPFTAIMLPYFRDKT